MCFLGSLSRAQAVQFMRFRNMQVNTQVSLSVLIIALSCLVSDAHDADGYACPCASVPSSAEDVPQYAPIPESALGANVSATGTGYLTEYLGEGAYG